MTKTILNEGEYYFTISQYKLYDTGVMVMGFTCDVGAAKGQTINVPFPTSNTARLLRLSQSINYTPFGEPTDENYGEQFIGLRVKGTVRILQEGSYLKNTVTSFALADAPSEIDVLKEKPTDQYYQQTNKKKLPIL